MLFEGQSLMVQVIKDPIGTKGARLSTQISIAGRMLVYPAAGQAHRRLAAHRNEAERESLREKLPTLAGETNRRLHPAHHGRGASDEELAKDIAYCARSGRDIKEQRRTAATERCCTRSCPGCSACCATSWVPKPTASSSTRARTSRS
jgi:ribonuclease G